MRVRKAGIAAIAGFLPDERLTNERLVEEFGTWTPEKIYHKTGITERRIAGKELVSDLAVGAAEALFSKCDIAREDIDILILCTETPDYLMPATACIVHDRLGLRNNSGAFDYNLGCSGYVYGLALAKSLILGNVARNVLLLTADVLTRFINPGDKSTRTIFGDAATATLVRDTEDHGDIGDFVMGTDGSGSQNLIIPAGGMAMPRSEETAQERKNRFGNIRSKDNFYMNGPEVLQFSMREVPLAVKAVLEKNSLGMDDIDLFVFHQATRLMLEHLRVEMNIPEPKFYMNMEKLGNTVSSTIPLALEQAEREGRIKKGDRVLLAGFGVGYSWSATVLEW